MILQGNQRGGGRDLALHLLKEENDHVEVHELRGFVSSDLKAAFDEAYAVSKCTKAKQYLFSLSLNPPEKEKVATDSFKEAIAKVENSLNLKDQPRAIVFHEKNGRRHCHVVWSRTDTKHSKAIPLPHTKRKLMDISRELFVQHNWKMPPGMMRSEERDPLNFNLAQWQQAKRIGKDPREIKQIFQECWATSDNQVSFAQALKSRGYVLARGNRGRFIALDHRCEPFAVPKWVGLKAKDVKAKLGEADGLPSFEQAKTSIAGAMSNRLTELQEQKSSDVSALIAVGKRRQKEMTARHKQERAELEQKQQERFVQDVINRQNRFRGGLSGLWDRLTGHRSRVRKQIEMEALLSAQRDQKEKDELIFNQLQERQALQSRTARLDKLKAQRHNTLEADIRQYRDVQNQKQDAFDASQERSPKGPSLER